MEQPAGAMTAFGQRLFALTRARFGEGSSSSSSLQRSTNAAAGVGAAVSRKLRALLTPASSLRQTLLAAGTSGGDEAGGEHDESYLLYDTHSLLLLDRSEAREHLSLENAVLSYFSEEFCVIFIQIEFCIFFNRSISRERQTANSYDSDSAGSIEYRINI